MKTKGRTRRLDEVMRAIFVDQEKIDKVMQMVGKSGLPAEVLQAYDLEWHGGDCPICGRAWVPVQAKVEIVRPARPSTGGKETKVAFADFLYFKPNCRCFRRCERGYLPDGRHRPGCGRLMIEERLLGIRRCVNCGAIPYHKREVKGEEAERGRGAKVRGEGEALPAPGGQEDDGLRAEERQGSLPGV